MSTLASTQPFRIGIPDQVLDDLSARLRRTRRVRVLKGGGWDAGSDPDYLDELIRYWRDDFDWRQRERELNQLAHYVARIDGANIHYVHETGLGVRSTPVLLLHGWPDSFLRYEKAIPLLVGAEHDTAEDLTCDVVVPSLPGFAFTGQIGPSQEIPSIKSSAKLLHRLMTEVLGNETYVVAGGDGGSAIAQSMAIQFPGSVIGIHLTDIGWQGGGDDSDGLNVIERQYVAAMTKKFMEDGAYVAVQASQPRALAASLNDSPAGLASWIVDRFHSWCNSPRHLERCFSKDEILTNITIYWITQTIQSSIYGYLAETRQPSLGKFDRVDVPVGLALFPRDMAGIPPRRLAERRLNVVRWTEMSSGGHFGAWERPEEYATDLKAFVGSLYDPVTLRAQHGHRPGKAI
ncbi:MAG: epoxide hydrolase family protein [Pseudomonadota bacterium]